MCVCVCHCSHSKRKNSKAGNLAVPVLVGEMCLHSGSVEVSEGGLKMVNFIATFAEHYVSMSKS